MRQEGVRKMKKLNKKGFTLVEIMIVVAIIGLLAAIAIPNFVKARTQAQTNSCIANLKQIDGAKQIWAIDSGGTEASLPVMATHLVPTYIKRTPTCPASGTYTVGTVGIVPVCDQTDHEL